GLVAGPGARRIDDAVGPLGQGELDLGGKHQRSIRIGPSTAWQRPCTQSQDWMSFQPQTEAMPLAAHCARTAAGSTAASRLTQAGKWAQQLPTFFTAQSLATRQLASTAPGAASCAGVGVGVAAGDGSTEGAVAVGAHALAPMARHRATRAVRTRIGLRPS